MKQGEEAPVLGLVQWSGRGMEMSLRSACGGQGFPWTSVASQKEIDKLLEKKKAAQAALPIPHPLRILWIESGKPQLSSDRKCKK